MKPTKTCHIIRALLKSVGSDLQVDHNGLPVSEPVAPSVWLSSDDFRREWFAYNLVRKREVDRPETTDAAKAAFSESEARCAAIEREGILGSLDWLSRGSILGARRIAHDVLGTLPRNWYRECTFTGGASTSRRRSDSHPAQKWWACPSLHVTSLAEPHLMSLMNDSEVLQSVWGDPGILSCTSYSHGKKFSQLVPGSRLDFVEKNYKTKRAILIEPDGNMLLQKGVGNIIRKRLMSNGINLRDQTRNQRLAFAGSISGSLGTIDLSAASDSVTLALLRIILPEDWYELIYELRSPVYLDGSDWKTMRKVSSMGNGFTFELESLVFYCLTQAVVDLLKPTERRVGIYGDDIIVASSVCGALESVLNRCGFSLNKEKSYWHGPFRESCGKHYHHGADVTPVYIKADLDCVSQLYRLYNQVRMWAGGPHFDSRYTRTLDGILSHIPSRDRNQVPLEYSSTSGIWFGDVCTRKIRLFLNKRGSLVMSFVSLEPSRVILDARVDSELAWLYRHCERWVASDPLGFSDYTPLTLVREGELVRRSVVTPVVGCSLPIP